MVCKRSANHQFHIPSIHNHWLDGYNWRMKRTILLGLFRFLILPDHSSKIFAGHFIIVFSMIFFVYFVYFNFHDDCLRTIACSCNQAFESIQNGVFCCFWSFTMFPNLSWLISKSNLKVKKVKSVSIKLYHIHTADDTIQSRCNVSKANKLFEKFCFFLSCHHFYSTLHLPKDHRQSLISS